MYAMHKDAAALLEGVHAAKGLCTSSTARSSAPAAQAVDPGSLPLNVISKVEEKLGSGSFGTVYKCAYHPRVEGGEARAAVSQAAAVKILKKPLKDMDDREIKYLKGEVENQSVLDHPNVCKLFEVGLTSNKFVFLVLEYVDGCSLAEGLSSLGLLRYKDELLSSCCACGQCRTCSTRVLLWKLDALHRARYKLFHRMMLGLQYCHSMGVYNRDVKPGNCLLPDGVEVKVADFGFSKSPFAEQGPLSSNVGSGPYKAPEVETCVPGYDGEKADVFSSGVTLYEIEVGFVAFLCDDDRTELNFSFKKDREKYFANKTGRPLRFLDDADPDLRQLLEGMLAPDPKERLSVAEVLGHRWIKSVTNDNDQAAVRLGGLSARSQWELTVKQEEDARVKQCRERMGAALQPILAAHRTLRPMAGMYY